MQKTIQTLSKSQYFNTTYNEAIAPRSSFMKCCCCALYFCCFGWIVGCVSGKGCTHMCCCSQADPPSAYVGTKFTQAHMKKLIGLFKRRRRTFKRRFVQIMRKINPRISVYLSLGAMGFGADKDKKKNGDLDADLTPFDE